MYLLTKIRNFLEILESLSSGIPTPTLTYTNKFGENTDIDIADTTGSLNQVIWPIKSSIQTYPFIDTPILLTLQSDSPNDTLLGSGANTVTIAYQDNVGIEQVISIDMDGTTPIPLPTTSYGCFRMAIGESGVSNTNEGNITLKNGTTIYAQISVGEGQTLMAIQRIPNNVSNARLKYARVTYARTGPVGTATMRLKVRTEHGTILTKLNANLVSSGLTNFEHRYDIGGIDLLPGSWIYWECTAVSANDTPIAGYFDIINNFIGN